MTDPDWLPIPVAPIASEVDSVEKAARRAVSWGLFLLVLVPVVSVGFWAIQRLYDQDKELEEKVSLLQMSNVKLQTTLDEKVLPDLEKLLDRVWQQEKGISRIEGQREGPKRPAHQ